jgi:hypothetical protein
MTEDRFWEIISLLDWEQAGDDDAVLRPAVAALAAASEADILAFEEILAAKLYAIDTREHARYGYQGEADPDNGDDYISADDFLYLRCVVVANGRERYREVLADPREMPTQLEFESLLRLAPDAFEEKTGSEYDGTTRVSYESFSNQEGWKPTAQTRGGQFTGPSIPPGNRRPT